LLQSVRLTPGLALLVAVFREPACFESPTVGVGMRAIVCRLGRPRLAVLLPLPFPLDP
jgi:hypothetical protein